MLAGIEQTGLSTLITQNFFYLIIKKWNAHNRVFIKHQNRASSKHEQQKPNIKIFVQTQAGIEPTNVRAFTNFVQSVKSRHQYFRFLKKIAVSQL